MVALISIACYTNSPPDSTYPLMLSTSSWENNNTSFNKFNIFPSLFSVINSTGALSLSLASSSSNPSIPSSPTPPVDDFLSSSLNNVNNKNLKDLKNSVLCERCHKECKEYILRCSVCCKTPYCSDECCYEDGPHHQRNCEELKGGYTAIGRFTNNILTMEYIIYDTLLALKFITNYKEGVAKIPIDIKQTTRIVAIHLNPNQDIYNIRYKEHMISLNATDEEGWITPLGLKTMTVLRYLPSSITVPEGIINL